MAYTTINKPQDYFNTKTYTGTGATGNSQTVGFQPDLLWFKNRSTALNHMWFDSVRGVTKYFYGNLNEAEGTTTAALESIDSNGFTVGANNNVNQNTNNIVAWNWLAGGSASSNTDGTITSSVSANTTAGFSIVSYTGNGTAGATVGHGLGVAPDVVIGKNRDTTSTSWAVYHKSIGTDLVFLDATDASASYSTIYNSTAPSSSVVTLGSGSNANKNNDEIILYCFAEKKGYSKFGKYRGNSSTDGTFIYTGFKPAWFMQKRTDATNGWHIFDLKRDTHNVSGKYLTANQTSTEPTGTYLDILSNGIKMRRNGADVNQGTYIYMAFAEAPTVGSNNVPATAR